MFQRAVAFAAALGLGCVCFGIDTVELAGVVDKVTVYRGQALVTRTVEAPGPAGLREIVVGELPGRIVPESLYAETAGGGEVRSVRYRERPVEQDVREDVRKLDVEIQGVQDQIEAVTQRLKLLGEHKVYLGNLEQFSAVSATTELQKGLLNSDTLKSLTLFLLEQRRSATDEELELRIQERELRERISALQRQRQNLTAGSAKSHREAVVLLNVTDPAGARLLIHYLVNDAMWQPSYNVRAGDEQTILVEYQASVRQMSGEDWNDVEMTLSTATPSLVAKAPELAPLSVKLTAATLQEPVAVDAREQQIQMQQLRMQRGELEKMRNLTAKQSAAGGKGKEESDLDVQLNELASRLQFYDIINRDQVDRNAVKDIEPAQCEGLSVTYQLPARTSLPSRTDQQLVQIAKLPMPAEFYRTATPVLTSYVYREAAVRNNSLLVLLAGPASTYVAGQFVGHGAIPTVTTGEEFTVGLGIDASLRASRELVSRKESTQGGNRSVEFSYRLAIENFGEPVAVRLRDRIPSGKDREIKVTLVDSTVPRVEESGERDKDSGLLRWDVEVPQNAIANAAKTVEYTYRLEYDKTMSITGGLAMATDRG